MYKIVVKGGLSPAESAEIMSCCPGATIVSGTDEEIASSLPDTEVVWGSLDPAQLAQAEKLLLMQVVTAGVDHLLSPELLASHARLCTTSGMHGATIAEHVFSLVLAFARGLPTLFGQQQLKVWQHYRPTLLQGQVMGIVGFGSIGQAIGQRALAFGLQVIGLRRNPSPSPSATMVWGEDRLDELLPLVDHLVLAVPLTPATTNLLSQERLKLLKPSVYLYNIARGAVVDEDALAAALAQGELAGAGLDVFATEPLPPDSPLWSLNNAIITPHTAGYLADYRRQALAIFLDNLRRLKQGLPLANEVDKGAGY
ncbi:MAG: Glyoxylate/hydroxypyruvate reductase B [Firmicutes bacterium]|nr:Glyoxylate/hydroxypyruvate reductase B [Bacillota bacterium]